MDPIERPNWPAEPVAPSPEPAPPPAAPAPYYGNPPPRASSPFPVWILVVVVVFVAAIPAVGVFAALAIYGVRRYVFTAKTAEAKVGIGRLAKDIVACAEQRGTLPPTSDPVPADLSDVAGRKYQSSPGEWASEAFTCGGFRMLDPQYYQYQWVRDSDSRGRAVARGDLDGDGLPSEYTLEVICTGSTCSVTTRFEERAPLE